jgi:hypothetical protein
LDSETGADIITLFWVYIERNPAESTRTPHEVSEKLNPAKAQRKDEEIKCKTVIIRHKAEKKRDVCLIRSWH